jgi:hypothetical protein
MATGATNEGREDQLVCFDNPDAHQATGRFWPSARPISARDFGGWFMFSSVGFSFVLSAHGTLFQHLKELSKHVFWLLPVFRVLQLSVWPQFLRRNQRLRQR